MEQNLESGMTLQQAVSQFDNDDYFYKWYEDTKLSWNCWCSSKGGIMFRKFRKNKSIFSYLLLGMCMLILAETAILSESLRVGGIYEKLTRMQKILWIKK